MESPLPAPAFAPSWPGYRPLRELGHGASGTVVLAEDLATGERVAIKRFGRGLSGSGAEEAAILAGIRFPGVVRLRHATCDPADGAFLAVFDWIDGADLLRATEQAPLGELARLLAGVLRGLAFVHERGLLHRDIKTDNVLVDAAERGATLLDFGFAAPVAAGAGSTAGTLAYLAPEVAAGASATVRSDLYSIGVVLYQLLARRLPSAGLADVDVVRLHASSDLHLPESVANGLPGALVDLVHALLRRAPAQRPSSAAAVLESLARALDAALPLETAATLLGRIRSLEFPLPPQHRERVLEHARRGGVLSLALPPGNEAWLLRCCIDWAAAGLPVARVVLGADGAVPAEATAAPAGVLLVECRGVLSQTEEAWLADRVQRGARGAPNPAVVVALDDDAKVPAALGRAAGTYLEIPRPPEAVLRERTESALRAAVPESEWRRLRLCDVPTPESVVAGLEEAAARGVLGTDGQRARWDRASLPDHFAAPATVARARVALAGLTEPERRALAALGRIGLPLERATLAPVVGIDLAALDAALDTLLLCRLIAREAHGARLEPASEAVAAAAIADLGRAEAQAILERAVDLLEGEPCVDALRSGEIGLLLAEAGRPGRAAAVLVEAGSRLRLAGRSPEARRYLERALPLCDPAAAPELRVRALRWLADCALLEGREREARTALEEAVALPGGSAEDVARSLAVLARALDRLGERGRALAELERGLAMPGISGATRSVLLTARSGLHAAERRCDEAERDAREALLAAGAGPTLERGAAAFALAALVSERESPDEAVQLLAEAQRIGAAIGRPDMSALAAADVGRLLLYRGRVAEAVEIQGAALAEFERAGQLRHAENLIATLAAGLNRLGRTGAVRALAPRARALQEAGAARLGHAMLLRHLAEAELRNGNAGEAERLLRESVQLRETFGAPAVQAAGIAELGRARAWIGDAAGSRREFKRALALARLGRSPEAMLEVALGVAEQHLLEGRPGAAERLVRGARRRSASKGNSFLDQRGDAVLAAAALARRDGTAAGKLCDAALGGAARSAPTWPIALLQAWRGAAADLLGDAAAGEADFAAALSALAEEGFGPERALVLAARARARLRATAASAEDATRSATNRLAAALDGAREDAAEATRLAEALCNRPLQALMAALRAELDAAAGAERGAALSGIERRLRVMERQLRINNAINSELDLRRLLRLILDEAIELCGARRGFVVLVKGTKIEVPVARNFAEQDIQHPEFEISHSVARNVALSGEPIRTSDSLHDQRLRSIASIADLRVLSILCVPLRARSAVLGSIYLDHPDVIDRFDESDLEFLTDFAAAAGIALERARLHQENLERAEALTAAKHEIERLNAELQAKVDAQAQELDQAKDTIEAERRAAVRRFDYRHIVAESPAMEEVRRRVDRITRTDFPVLILGESGTGKELVARAVHHNGARAAQSFVSVNCAAMPEALVEVELFGAAKGAYTGADRDRKGLFELAHRGTLFLDEIGDMSLEVQKRLLRVVQYGDFFPLGSKRPVSVDVRIISATHRDLKAMIARGEFREDLYYRLNVAPVHLPPLRERAGDVRLLIAHFTAGFAAGGRGVAKRFAPEAFAALERYSWPGNVRELENEVKRLLFLHSDRDVIELCDLPEALSAALPRQAALPRGPSSRSLKEQVEGFERDVAEETLRQCGGNKREAARRLGMSPRGLYKLLERVGSGEGAGGRPDPAAGQPEGEESTVSRRSRKEKPGDCR